MPRTPAVTHTVLLDLDGTLADSRPGIEATFRFMLAEMGHDPAVAGGLTWAVGPPIGVSIRGLLARCGDAPPDPARVERAIAVYRARYSAVGPQHLSVAATLQSCGRG